MPTTRVLTQQCTAKIVHNVGLDDFLDELLERLRVACRTHDPEVIDTVARNGFRYTKPDLGLLEWMPAMELGRRAAVKLVGYHPSNPVERGTPSVLSATVLHDTTDGRMLALCESSFLTAIRTGAASALATDVLAIDRADTLGMIGCGSQAVTQIHAISRVRPIRRVLAFDTDEGVSGSLRDRLARTGLGSTVEVVDHAERAVADVDVLCTATSVEPGQGPVVPHVAHRPWLHVNAVGADHPGKMELPVGLLDNAFIVPDVLDQCLAEGESQQIDPNSLGPELPEMVRHAQRHSGRRSGLTVFDSTGWALEDLVAAEMLLDHAERLDEGVSLDLQPRPRDPYDPYDFLEQ